MYKQRYYPAGFLMRRFFFVLFSDKGRTTLRHFPAAWSLFVHFCLGVSPTPPRNARPASFWPLELSTLMKEDSPSATAIDFAL